jgi:Tachylectin
MRFKIPPRRVIAGAMGILVAASLGLAAATFSATVSTPAPAYATSSLGGQITRSEVIDRATDWYNRRYDSDLTYSQTSYTWDGIHSRQYRRDCSGFVDMSWHLNADPNSDGLDSSTYTYAISRSELKPGDLLDDPGVHAILFGGWEDSAKTTFWYYSFGSTPLVKRTGVSFSQSTMEGHPTSSYKSLRYKNIVDDISGSASIYGVLSDGRMTYTVVDAATGVRTHGAVVSAASLGFVPTAMATLNFNTILVTTSSGSLYRIDVITNSSSLTFATPVYLGGGWTHDLLAYDGNGHLFGIADGVLMRYTVTATKPALSNITSRVVIDGGFTLKTLTTTGPDWILGTVSDGRLMSYKIRGASDWTSAALKTSTWQVFDSLMSPGGGVYFGHESDGSLYRYLDQNPYDYNGSDLTGLGAVDTSGWSQVRLSAQPRTVS